MLVLSREVDQQIRIGDSLVVGPTDIDPKSVRLLARGRAIGGPDDGATFTKVAELGRGGEMRLGPHVVVTVIDIRGHFVRLGVQAPPHMEVTRAEGSKKSNP